MKQLLAHFFLFLYHNVKKSTSLRKLIKLLLNTQKINVNFNGFRMYAGIDSAIESNIVFNSYNEIMVLKLIKKYANEGFDFIDIGANVGIHSLTAATANPNIEIFSFEPESSNFKHFIDNMGLNEFRNIRPFKMGLGNFNGITILNINEGWNKGRHSLKVDFDGAGGKLTIPVRQLDTLAENINSKQLLFKIDVEGFEKEVIQGAHQLLQQTTKAVLIIELVTEINGKETCHEIVKNLQSYQFDAVYKIDSDNKLVKVNDFDSSADYVFFKGIAPEGIE